jgi:DNA topoisomerase-6 subunit B
VKTLAKNDDKKIKKEDKEIAEKFAESHKAISVAEFFEKNRHLLGFDSRIKAMLTCVKEAVDNSLDATQEYNYELIKRGSPPELPEIRVDIKNAEHSFGIIEEGHEEAIAELIKRKKEWYVVYHGKQLRASSREKGGTSVYKVDENTIKLTETNGKPKVQVNGKDAKLNEIVEKYRITITDNGPGIVKEQIPNIFGKFLYGSKFFRLRQSRGQQGIGIHSAVLYAQLTTGLPVRVTSRIAKSKPAHMMEVGINTVKNEPDVVSEGISEDFKLDHGTSIEMTIDGDYIASGEKSVYEFLRRSAIVNPHVTIVFTDPEKKTFRFDRISKELPKEPYEIKPHPHGMELGILMRMLRLTDKRTLKAFLTSEFSRVGPSVADQILGNLKLEDKKPNELERTEIESLLKALQKAPLLRPPTDCLSPIGDTPLQKSLQKETGSEFVAVVSRPPAVYRGMPFLVECGIAYGGEIKQEGQAERLRFANRIPLLYDAAACALTHSIQEVDWKRYNVQNLTTNNIPVGPYVIIVHIASVWVPYTSEGKSAIAGYPEIIKEVKLALQDCARKLGRYLSGKRREHEAKERASLFEKYVPELAEDLSKLTGEQKTKITAALEKVLKKGTIDVSEEAEDMSRTSGAELESGETSEEPSEE